MKATTPRYGTENGITRIRSAFTLIELLVVIAIIAILVGMGAYVYPRAIDQAKKTRTKALISDVVNAVKAYQLEYNRLPVDSSSDENTFLTRLLIGSGPDLALRWVTSKTSDASTGSTPSRQPCS